MSKVYSYHMLVEQATNPVELPDNAQVLSVEPYKGHENPVVWRYVLVTEGPPA